MESSSNWQVTTHTSAYQQKEEQKQALDRCLYSANETLEQSHQAKLQLQQQEEVIRKMDNNLDTMDRNLKKSEYLVRGMSSTMGFLKNLFTSKKTLQKLDEKPEPPPPVLQTAVQQVSSDSQASDQKATIAQQTSQLDQLLGAVKSIKAVNEDIGSTLERQNDMLDRVNGKMDRNQERMDKVDGKLKKILR